MLVVHLRLRQLLHALLVFAPEPEGRYLQPRRAFAPPGVEVGRGVLHPLLEALLALPAHGAEHLRERILTGGTERLFPRARDFARAGVAAGMLRGDLLHLPEPMPRLLVEARDDIVCFLAAAVRELAPPIDGVMPGLRRRGLGRTGRRAAHRIAPRAPVPARQRIEVVCHRSSIEHAAMLAPPLERHAFRPVRCPFLPRRRGCDRAVSPGTSRHRRWAAVGRDRCPHPWRRRRCSA